MSSEIPTSHPRYASLMQRERIVNGVRDGLTSMHGLVAQGRGEAFDYLFGEKTHEFARTGARAAAALLLLAKHPVLSVNGNAVALVADEMVELSRLLQAPLQVNIFHPSKERELAIAARLSSCGAERVLLPLDECLLPGFESNRRRCHPEGILKADVVFVPLEDGDRTEALVALGKKVIVVDLNPNCRSARRSTIPLVDNVIRALPLLSQMVLELRDESRESLQRLVEEFSKEAVLASARRTIGEVFGGSDVTLS